MPYKKDGSVKNWFMTHSCVSCIVLYIYHTRKEKPCLQECSKLLYMCLVVKKLKNTESLYSDRQKMEGPKEIQFLKDNKLYHITHTGRNIL